MLSAYREDPSFFAAAHALDVQRCVEWALKHFCARETIASSSTSPPKHASWLNQVKIWFSILVRKLIRRGNFSSKQMLKTRIEQFIAYFNATMARPFRWTYAGKPLAG